MSRDLRMVLTIVGAVLGLGFLLKFSIPPADYVERERETVTVAAPAPTVDVAPDEDRPTPHPTPTPRVVMSEALVFECPEGELIVPWNTDFDSAPQECLRKLWALRAREGALHPLYARYRKARCGAAWAACPKWFRR